LLDSAATIINNEGKLNFTANEYRLFDLHLSPTVYELLKRFEFIWNKHVGDEEIDQVQEPTENQ